jgi:hypothetical protein
MLNKAVAFRAALLLLLAGVVISTQTASAATGHLHHHSSEHCCTLCHSGSPPLVQPSVAGAAVHAVAVAWLERFDGLEAPRDAVRLAPSSRAPPR